MDNKRPPLGLKPKSLWEYDRLKEIEGAIKRYIENCRLIPIEWVQEYNELAEKWDGGENNG